MPLSILAPTKSSQSSPDWDRKASSSRLGIGSAPSLGVGQGIIDDFNQVKDSVRDSLGECLRYVGRNPVEEFFVVVNGDHLVSENSTEMLGRRWGFSNRNRTASCVR